MIPKKNAPLISAKNIPGYGATAPWEIPVQGWKAIMKRVWVMNDFHNLALLSAGVSFYAFLAFVPLIAAIVLVYGLVGNPDAVMHSIANLQRFTPPEVAKIVQDQLLAIVTSSAGVKGFGLLLAVLVAIFGTMRASSAMMKVLNIIYEEYESRNVVQIYLVSTSITLGMIAVGIIGIFAVSLFGFAQIVLTRYLGGFTVTLITLLTWVLAAALVSLTFAIFYRFAPDRRKAKWRWLTLGSIVATLLWVLATYGFGIYAANISDYNATYGSLAAVVIFQMWLFLSSYAILIGAEINAEAERQTFRDSTVGPDRPLGERGAVMADTTVLGEVRAAVLQKKQQRRADRLARKCDTGQR